MSSHVVALSPDTGPPVHGRTGLGLRDLSDGAEAIDRGKKRPIYRREGVGHLWFVDPRDRSLEIWKLVDARWVEVDTFEGEGPVHGRPFESAELDLGALWHW